MPQHQLELLNALSMQFASNEYRLLIIDSIMNCFRVDFCGRGELADRQQKLNQFLSKLAHMAEGSPSTVCVPTSPADVLLEFNVCVLMVKVSTNHRKKGTQLRNRPIKCKATQALVPSLPVQTAASLLEATSLHTHLRLEFSSERVAARSVWLRSKILQVYSGKV